MAEKRKPRAYKIADTPYKKARDIHDSYVNK